MVSAPRGDNDAHGLTRFFVIETGSNLNPKFLKCGDVEVTDACVKDELIGHHGRWLFYGEYLEWIKAGIELVAHREVLDRCPWYLCTTPSLESESKVEF